MLSVEVQKKVLLKHLVARIFYTSKCEETITILWHTPDIMFLDFHDDGNGSVNLPNYYTNKQKMVKVFIDS